MTVKADMTTLLFFYDNALGVRENVVRGVGKPELLPESVWHDDDRLNPPGAIPASSSMQPDRVWRMAYQAKLVVRPPPSAADRSGKLVADSDDGLHWRPRDTRKDVKTAAASLPASGHRMGCGVVRALRRPDGAGRVERSSIWRSRRSGARPMA